VFKVVKQTTTVLATQAVLLWGALDCTLAATFNLESATVADINAAFDAGALTSQRLTQLYLNRYLAFNASTHARRCDRAFAYSLQGNQERSA